MSYFRTTTLVVFFLLGLYQTTSLARQHFSEGPSQSQKDTKSSKVPRAGETTIVLGSVVEYDPVSLTRGREPEGEFVVRLKIEGEYVRLRYNPYAFGGYEAPPVVPEDRWLPKEMFSDSHITWAFHVHAPRQSYEYTECNLKVVEYAPDKKGNVVEVKPRERFLPMPGAENYKIPKPESLPCYIVESWTKISAP